MRVLIVAVLVAWSLLAGPLPARASGEAGATHSGLDRQLQVRPPRVEVEVVIDGVLDEPVWSEAARLTGFSRYAPV